MEDVLSAAAHCVSKAVEHVFRAPPPDSVAGVLDALVKARLSEWIRAQPAQGGARRHGHAISPPVNGPVELATPRRPCLRADTLMRTTDGAYASFLNAGVNAGPGAPCFAGWIEPLWLEDKQAGAAAAAAVTQGIVVSDGARLLHAVIAGPMTACLVHSLCVFPRWKLHKEGSWHVVFLQDGFDVLSLKEICSALLDYRHRIAAPARPLLVASVESAPSQSYHLVGEVSSVSRVVSIGAQRGVFVEVSLAEACPCGTLSALSSSSSWPGECSPLENQSPREVAYVVFPSHWHPLLHALRATSDGSAGLVWISELKKVRIEGLPTGASVFQATPESARLRWARNPPPKKSSASPRPSAISSQHVSLPKPNGAFSAASLSSNGISSSDNGLDGGDDVAQHECGTTVMSLREMIERPERRHACRLEGGRCGVSSARRDSDRLRRGISGGVFAPDRANNDAAASWLLHRGRPALHSSNVHGSDSASDVDQAATLYSSNIYGSDSAGVVNQAAEASHAAPTVAAASSSSENLSPGFDFTGAVSVMGGVEFVEFDGDVRTTLWLAIPHPQQQQQQQNRLWIPDNSLSLSLPRGTHVGCSLSVTCIHPLLVGGALCGMIPCARSCVALLSISEADAGPTTMSAALPKQPQQLQGDDDRSSCDLRPQNRHHQQQKGRGNDVKSSLGSNSLPHKETVAAATATSAHSLNRQSTSTSAASAALYARSLGGTVLNSTRVRMSPTTPLAALLEEWVQWVGELDQQRREGTDVSSRALQSRLERVLRSVQDQLWLAHAWARITVITAGTQSQSHAAQSIDGVTLSRLRTAQSTATAASESAKSTTASESAAAGGNMWGKRTCALMLLMILPASSGHSYPDTGANVTHTSACGHLHHSSSIHPAVGDDDASMNPLSEQHRTPGAVAHINGDDGTDGGRGASAGRKPTARSNSLLQLAPFFNPCVTTRSLASSSPPIHPRACAALCELPTSSPCSQKRTTRCNDAIVAAAALPSKLSSPLSPSKLSLAAAPGSSIPRPLANDERTSFLPLCHVHSPSMLLQLAADIVSTALPEVEHFTLPQCLQNPWATAYTDVCLASADRFRAARDRVAATLDSNLGTGGAVDILPGNNWWSFRVHSHAPWLCLPYADSILAGDVRAVQQQQGEGLPFNGAPLTTSLSSSSSSSSMRGGSGKGGAAPAVSSESLLLENSVGAGRSLSLMCDAIAQLCIVAPTASASALQGDALSSPSTTSTTVSGVRSAAAADNDHHDVGAAAYGSLAVARRFSLWIDVIRIPRRDSDSAIPSAASVTAAPTKVEVGASGTTPSSTTTAAAVATATSAATTAPTSASTATSSSISALAAAHATHAVGRPSSITGRSSDAFSHPYPPAVPAAACSPGTTERGTGALLSADAAPPPHQPQRLRDRRSDVAPAIDDYIHTLREGLSNAPPRGPTASSSSSNDNLMRGIHCEYAGGRYSLDCILPGWNTLLASPPPSMASPASSLSASPRAPTSSSVSLSAAASASSSLSSPASGSTTISTAGASLSSSASSSPAPSLSSPHPPVASKAVWEPPAHMYRVRVAIIAGELDALSASEIGSVWGQRGDRSDIARPPHPAAATTERASASSGVTIGQRNAAAAATTAKLPASTSSLVTNAANAGHSSNASSSALVNDPLHRISSSSLPSASAYQHTTAAAAAAAASAVPELVVSVRGALGPMGSLLSEKWTGEKVAPPHRSPVVPAAKEASETTTSAAVAAAVAASGAATPSSSSSSLPRRVAPFTLIGRVMHIRPELQDSFHVCANRTAAAAAGVSEPFFNAWVGSGETGMKMLVTLTHVEVRTSTQVEVERPPSAQVESGRCSDDDTSAPAIIDSIDVYVSPHQAPGIVFPLGLGPGAVIAVSGVTRCVSDNLKVYCTCSGGSAGAGAAPMHRKVITLLQQQPMLRHYAPASVQQPYSSNINNNISSGSGSSSLLAVLIDDTGVCADTVTTVIPATWRNSATCYTAARGSASSCTAARGSDSFGPRVVIDCSRALPRTDCAANCIDFRPPSTDCTVVNGMQTSPLPIVTSSPASSSAQMDTAGHLLTHHDTINSSSGSSAVCANRPLPLVALMLDPTLDRRLIRVQGRAGAVLWGCLQWCDASDCSALLPLEEGGRYSYGGSFGASLPAAAAAARGAGAAVSVLGYAMTSRPEQQPSGPANKRMKGVEGAATSTAASSLPSAAVSTPKSVRAYLKLEAKIPLDDGTSEAHVHCIDVYALEDVERQRAADSEIDRVARREVAAASALTWMSTSLSLDSGCSDGRDTVSVSAFEAPPPPPAAAAATAAAGGAKLQLGECARMLLLSRSRLVHWAAAAARFGPLVLENGFSVGMNEPSSATGHTATAPVSGAPSVTFTREFARQIALHSAGRRLRGDNGLANPNPRLYDRSLVDDRAAEPAPVQFGGGSSSGSEGGSVSIGSCVPSAGVYSVPYADAVAASLALHAELTTARLHSPAPQHPQQQQWGTPPPALSSVRALSALPALPSPPLWTVWCTRFYKKRFAERGDVQAEAQAGNEANWRRAATLWRLGEALRASILRVASANAAAVSSGGAGGGGRILEVWVPPIDPATAAAAASPASAGAAAAAHPPPPPSFRNSTLTLDDAFHPTESTGIKLNLRAAAVQRVGRAAAAASAIDELRSALSGAAMG